MNRNEQDNEISSQMYQRYAPMADEIDLLDIWRILVAQKWLIFGITVFCTTLAVGAALLLPRAYRAEVSLLPPLAETIEQLNVPNIEESSGFYFFKVDSQELYHGLIENLQSNWLQRKFFDDNELAPLLSKKNDNRSVDIIFKEEFSKKLLVGGINNKRESGFVTVTLEGQRPEQIAGWLNKFVQLADKKTIVAQTRSFAMKAQRVKDSVAERMSSLRSVEKARRFDLIARLDEAVVVAEKL
ncbi:MAG: Wzz/FepE/Etk N-terminal domain-containing protein, partial [Thermodesulfobacteriota bacterium]|nr:Wzz/FepE/Etk N-terminal domain-containing protein [Thermodesulfobacteriota bacterium]